MLLIRRIMIFCTMLILLSACATNHSSTDHLDENLIATWRFVDSDYHFMTFLENGQGFSTSCAVIVETGNEDNPTMECAELRSPTEYFRWEAEDDVLEITFLARRVPEFWEYELIEDRIYFADFAGEPLVKVENILLEPTLDLNDFSSE